MMRVPDDVEQFTLRACMESAKLFGLSYLRVLSVSRRHPEVDARNCVFALMRARGFSLPAIGYLFGVHHTSVLCATIKAIKAQVDALAEATADVVVQPWHLETDDPKPAATPRAKKTGRFCPRCRSHDVFRDWEKQGKFVFCAKCDHEWQPPTKKQEVSA